MKIIAGELGSRTIKTLKSNTSRPTSAKIRAAIFDHLGSFFSGGTILDLFAGTGAMSFEALSRGFDQATLVEKDREAANIIRKNVDEFNLHNSTEINIENSINFLNSTTKRFDLIFIDPPYKYDQIERVIDLVASLDILEDRGYCIVETDARIPLKETYGTLKKYKKKKYGNTKIHYYKKA